MPNYLITAPDGKKYRVQAPQGASQADIMKRVEGHRRAKTAAASKTFQAKHPAMQSFKDGLDSFGSGIVGPWADEVSGVASAASQGIMKLVGGKTSAPTAATAFDKGQQRHHDDQKTYGEKHPALKATGMGMGIAGSLLFPEAKVAQGTNLAARVMNGATTAGLYGALMGAGQGEGTQRIGHATTGAGIGAFTGGVIAPALVGTAHKLARVAAPYIAKMGGEKAVNKVASSAAYRSIARAISAGKQAPADVATEIERRVAMGVPASPSDISEPLSQLTAVASRGIGPGQSAVREAVAKKQMGMAGRMRQHLDETLGSTVNPYAQSDALTEQARQAAKPLYDAAYATPLELTPQITEFMQSPIGKKAVSAGANQIENVPAHLRNAGSEQPFRTLPVPELPPRATSAMVPTSAPVPQAVQEAIPQKVPALETLDGGKQYMDDIEFQNQSHFLPVADGTTGDVRPIRLARQSLLDHLDTQVPAYGQARAAYAGPTRQKAAFNTGLEKVAGSARSTVDDASAQMADMTPSELEQFRLGDRTRLGFELFGSKRSVKPMADAAAPIIGNSGRRDLLGRVHGEDNASRLIDRAEAEQAGHRTFKKALGGSPTANNFADDASVEPDAIARSLALAAGGRPGMAAANFLQHAKEAWLGEGAQATHVKLGEILTQESPKLVKQAMSDIEAQMGKDAVTEENINIWLNHFAKQFALQGIGRSGDEDQAY